MSMKCSFLPFYTLSITVSVNISDKPKKWGSIFFLHENRKKTKWSNCLMHQFILNFNNYLFSRSAQNCSAQTCKPLVGWRWMLQYGWPSRYNHHKDKMEIGSDKTKVMTNITNGFQREIRIKGHRLEEVENFKYHGAIISNKGSKP